MRAHRPGAGLLAAALVVTHAAAEDVRQVNTCFEEHVAGLRLSQLEQGIALCTKVIEDKAAPAGRRGEAFAQRGLMHARRWSVVSEPTSAFQGIADLTEALQLHKPAMERRHLLLIIRAQLYAATGQRRRAADDYELVLKENPKSIQAKEGRSRLGLPEGL